MWLGVGALKASTRFLPAAWRGAWAAVLLLALAWAALAFANARLLASLAVAALGVVAEGALWRTALAAPAKGPGGLQWGAIEWHLLAVAALRLAFLGVLGSLLFVLVLIFAYAAAAAGPGFRAADVATWAPAVEWRGRTLVTIVAAVGGFGLAWAAARIATAEAATVSGGAVRVLAVWPSTRRQGLSILVASAIVAAPAIMLWLALRALTGAAAPPAWAVGAEGLVIAGQWLPMSVGLMAYAYDNRAVSDA